MPANLTDRTIDRRTETIFAEDDDSIDFVGLLRTLYEGRKLILTAGLVLFTAATALAFLLPFRYTATVAFIPPNLSSNSSMASALAGQLSVLGAGDILGGGRGSGDLYAGILRSRSVGDQLVKRFNLIDVYGVKKRSQAEDALQAETTITVDNKSTIITLEITDKNPRLAHDLAGAYMDALRDANGRMALSQSSQRRLFFGQQLEQEKDNLENAEVDLKKTQEQSGLISPTGQTEVEIRTIAETQAQIAVRQVELAALRQSATDQNPEVIRLRSEIQDLQGQLSRLQHGSADRNSATIPTSKVPELQLDYLRKQREVKYHEALFEMLSRQYEAARLEEARDAPVLQVLDPPSNPDTKSSPKRLHYMAGGLFAGLLLGSLWVLSRDRIKLLLSAVRHES